MAQNIVEYLREQAVSQLFDIRTLKTNLPVLSTTFNYFRTQKSCH